MRAVSREPFLVVYDYGQGGVWAYVKAASREEILQRFPELEVVEARPAWLTPDHDERIRRRTLDVDRPSGLLSDLIAARKGPSAGTG